MPGWKSPPNPAQPRLAPGLIDRLVDLSSRDPLTGSANRRQLELSLAREVDRVIRRSALCC